MGIVKHEASGRRVTLAMRSIVGRAEAAAVRLESHKSSGEHAVLFWDGARWSVRDLGSTNGTQLDDRRLALNERVHIDAGASLIFGDDAERWALEDAGPPGASARSEATGEVRAAEDGLLALPDASDPRVTLSEDRHGRWVLELDGGARPAVDHESIYVGGDLGGGDGGLWTLRVPPAHGERLPTTTVGAHRPKLIGATVLRFEVSRDGEHIDLSLVHGEEVTALGSRAHHEVLLLLARARLQDKRDGLSPAEQGWLYVDDVVRMLKLPLQHLNVYLFRARKHMASAGMIDTGAIVERRVSTRQIRLGTDVVDIIQL
jgi:FHA domain